MGRGVDVQQVAVCSGFEQADAPLGRTDQVIFRRLQLEVIHVELPVHLAAMEEELVCGDGKQGPGQLPYPLDIEILQILTGQNQCGIALSHPLEAVADVLNGGQVGQPEVELIQSGHGVPLGEELVAEVGQQVEQQGVLDRGVGTDQVLDAKHQEAALGSPQVRWTCGERRSSGASELFGFSRKRARRSL